MSRAKRTFDSRGNLLGDDTLSPDLQSFVDEANAGTSSGGVMQLPPMTVTASALPPFNFAALLQPPYLYFLVGAIALAAYLYSKEHS